ncbi:MAG: TetR family transcriptional regulator [Rhodobacteraceae bacterium]|nr:TetR family transcriptional regulator [Paracoccaceae bacterium]
MQSTTASTLERKRTASREVRRQQLIDATIDSIAKFGLSATTMATITKFANLSQGIVNFHFQTKERLLVEAIGNLADEHRALWQKRYAQTGSSARERLSALIESDYHPNICNRKKLTVWFAFYGEKKYRAAYRERCGEIDEDRVSETTRLCRQIKEEGDYKDVDALMFAQSLEAFTDGLWLNILLYPETFSRQRAKDECFAYLASVFPDHFSAPANSGGCSQS